MRRQTADQFHRFLNKTHVAQTDTVDPVYRVKADQQMWNNTEQWAGYSDTYLRKWMQYQPTVEMPNGLEFRHNELNDLLAIIHDVYGRAADILESLEDDPLQPAFHTRLEEALRIKQDFEAEIDKIYATLHPTYKTLVDAWMCRRVFVLEDWVTLVQRKRADIFTSLSPEFLEQQRRMRGLAEQHIARLVELGRALEDDPALFLAQDGRYTEDEVAVVRQRSTFYRKAAQMGKAQSHGECMPN